VPPGVRARARTLQGDYSAHELAAASAGGRRRWLTEAIGLLSTAFVLGGCGSSPVRALLLQVADGRFS
jgi:hypothetical protein